MKDRVRQYIKDQNLIEQGDRVLVGVSGGADSVCLLHLLDEYKDELGFKLYVVHINHGLRGVDADKDEAYVDEVCRKLGLYFHAYHVDVQKMARDDGLSSEEAGRKARYEVFYQECQRLQCNKVAVAHHMNDTAETVLFHLVRGTGLKGLTGIASRRDMGSGIEVIRPMLCVKREEIEEYLTKEKISYCIDQTNLTDEYSRNKLRNRILPYMVEEMNVETISHIAKTASHLQEVNDYIESNIDRVFPLYVIEEGSKNGYPYCVLSDEIRNEHIVVIKGLIRRILQKMLPNGLKDMDAGHIEQVVQMLDLGVGKMQNLPCGVLVKRGYHDIFFTFSDSESNTMNKAAFCMELNIHQPGEYELKEIGKTLRISVIEYKKNLIIPKNAYTKWFDYDKINNTVFVRTRQTGDYLQVREDGSKKKLKDYFIDRKIPREERDSYLLLADGKHIMWILSDRISEAYKVDATTKKILVISLIGGNDDGYQR